MSSDKVEGDPHFCKTCFHFLVVFPLALVTSMANTDERVSHLWDLTLPSSRSLPLSTDQKWQHSHHTLSGSGMGSKNLSFGRTRGCLLQALHRQRLKVRQRSVFCGGYTLYCNAFFNLSAWKERSEAQGVPSMSQEYVSGNVAHLWIFLSTSPKLERISLLN